MRVAMYYSNNDVRTEDAPVPDIGRGELLMRVEACGICGSDVMEWYRRDRVPLVLGHEVAGMVEAVGEGVEAFGIGDRITVAHHVPCNTCWYCLKGDHTVCDTLRKTNIDPGGFAEYARVPEINVDRGVFRLPDHVTFEEATFVEPVACVLRGQRRGGLQPGHAVLVLGAGIAGLLHVHLARALGAGPIVATDLLKHRLEAAWSFGATAAIDARRFSPEAFREVNDGRLADIVVVCTGAQQALAQALDSVERGGTALFFAPTDEGVQISKPLNEIFWRTDVTLATSYAGSPADYATALTMIGTGSLRVREMVTHRLGLDEAQAGFQMVVSPEEQRSIKVVVEPQR